MHLIFPRIFVTCICSIHKIYSLAKNAAPTRTSLERIRNWLYIKIRSASVWMWSYPSSLAETQLCYFHKSDEKWHCTFCLLYKNLTTMFFFAYREILPSVKQCSIRGCMHFFLFRCKYLWIYDSIHFFLIIFTKNISDF